MRYISTSFIAGDCFMQRIISSFTRKEMDMRRDLSSELPGDRLSR